VDAVTVVLMRLRTDPTSNGASLSELLLLDRHEQTVSIQQSTGEPQRDRETESIVSHSEELPHELEVRR
jgi:hypothetical protein